MNISSIDKEFLRYFIKLNNSQKQSLMELVKSFVNPGKELDTSSQQYNKELEDALQRIQMGEYTTIDDLEREMEKW